MQRQQLPEDNARMDGQSGDSKTSERLSVMEPVAAESIDEKLIALIKRRMAEHGCPVPKSISLRTLRILAIEMGILVDNKANDVKASLSEALATSNINGFTPPASASETFPTRITKAMRRYGLVVTMRYVESNQYRLVKPIDIRLEYVPADDAWEASFYPTHVGASGKTPHAAFQAMRAALIDIYEGWMADKDKPGIRERFAPAGLPLLEDYFARITYPFGKGHS